jgi:hypothetical protein
MATQAIYWVWDWILKRQLAYSFLSKKMKLTLLSLHFSLIFLSFSMINSKSQANLQIITNKYLDTPITFRFINSVYTAKDTQNCLLGGNIKIDKRMKRFACCFKAGVKCDHPDTWQHKIGEEIKSKEITLKELQDYISKPSGKSLGESWLPFGTPDDSIKKMIDAALTSAFNKNLGPYKYACTIVIELWTAILGNETLGPFAKAKRIIMYMKGGNAARFSLCLEHPNFIKDIEECFALGGDNDVGCDVDPQLPNRDKIRTYLIEFIYEFLTLKRLEASNICSLWAKDVKSIDLCGKTFKVTPAKKPTMKLFKKYLIISCIETLSVDTPVYLSYNDNLTFKSSVGDTNSFTLIRLKQAFKVGEKLLASELLDIAVTKFDDSHSTPEYFKNLVNSWTHIITI